MICATIYLTTAGTDTGNFSLYSDADSYTTAFETGVSKADLVAGYYTNLVPDGTTIIRVQSGTICVGYVDIIPDLVIGFTTEWTVSGDTAARTITLPGYDDGVFDAVVDWGDGTPVSTITTWNDANNIHIYTGNGVYNVEITGEYPGWEAANSPYRVNITDIIHWGTSSAFGGFSYIANGFSECFNLKTTGQGSILTKPGLYSVGGLFDSCSTLTGIINPNMFENCGDVTYTNWLFGDCTSLQSVPSGLFDPFTNSINAFGMFYTCTSLETVPDGLFRENTNIIEFGWAFRYCNKLQMNPWTFYYSGETATRFFNQSIQWDSVYERDSFTGTQGTAPDLWNCDYGTGTPDHSNAFYGVGNSLTSLTNYCDIPSSWGGTCPPTPTPSISVSVTPTVTPSISITPTVTPSISVSPTVTPSISISVTPTVTPSISVSPTVTPSTSVIPTPTPTPSPTPPTTVWSGLTSYYRMDTNSGTTAYDAIGSIDGTIEGTTTWETGKHNYGLLMDTTTDKINLGNNFNFERTDPFTFACWFKRTSTGVNNMIWSKTLNVSPWTGIGLQINASNQIVMNLIGQTTPSIKMISITTVTTYTDTSNWYHWAVTSDGSSTAAGVKLYINGSYVTSRNITQDGLDVSMLVTDDAQIGNRDSNQNPAKYMDEFGIWTRELTSTEISNLYNSGDGMFY